MESKNACPSCGSTDFKIILKRNAVGLAVRQATCCGCGSSGPEIVIEVVSDCGAINQMQANDNAYFAALHAFTHPAHMLDGKVLISRGTARIALTMLAGSGDVLSFDRDDAETELRAALEVKP